MTRAPFVYCDLLHHPAPPLSSRLIRPFAP